MHTRNDLVDIQVWLGYDHVHNVNSVGRSGSLAVFWNNSGIVNILSSNKNLVDLNVQFGDKKFFLFLVYMVIPMKAKDSGCGRRFLELELVGSFLGVN